MKQINNEKFLSDTAVWPILLLAKQEKKRVN